MTAAPVSIAIFEFLDSTHQEIQSHIKLLRALVDAIELRQYVSDDVGMPTLRDIVAELKKPGTDMDQAPSTVIRVVDDQDTLGEIDDHESVAAFAKSFALH